MCCGYNTGAVNVGAGERHQLSLTPAPVHSPSLLRRHAHVPRRACQAPGPSSTSSTAPVHSQPGIPPLTLSAATPRPHARASLPGPSCTPPQLQFAPSRRTAQRAPAQVRAWEAGAPQAPARLQLLPGDARGVRWGLEGRRGTAGSLEAGALQLGRGVGWRLARGVGWRVARRARRLAMHGRRLAGRRVRRGTLLPRERTH